VSELPEHVQRNREEWDTWADDYVKTGEQHWAADDASWGIWNVPESQLGLFAGVEEGMDAIELGCGTGYVSAWLARRGLKPVAIDNSEAQLATAERLQAEHGIEFPLLHGNAEKVPLPDASFDLAISEYGASIWCDPYEWIPEAARLLRPGGQLVFLVNSVLMMLCVPDEVDGAADEKLVRPMFGLHRMEWSDDKSVEFHLPHGKMISLLRSTGFEIEELLEIQVPDDSTSRYSLAKLDWARQWPCEEVWKARKRS
jgi:ubiquinone/menaquinone biosynthesis C-methylase UbiE